MNKEQSNAMFGVDSIDDWLNHISVCSPFILGGKAAMAISLLSDVQELSHNNNGHLLRPAINCVKYLLSLDPEETLERRIVGKLMHYLEHKGFEIVGVYDGEERYATGDLPVAMGHIFAVEEASLRVRSQAGNAGCEHGILLIPGNGEDIISDYSYSADDVDGFENAMNDFKPPES